MRTASGSQYTSTYTASCSIHVYVWRGMARYTQGHVHIDNMYICIGCICIHIHVHIRIDLYTYIYSFTSTCTFRCTCKCLCPCTYAYACIAVYSYLNAYVYMYARYAQATSPRPCWKALPAEMVRAGYSGFDTGR